MASARWRSSPLASGSWRRNSSTPPRAAAIGRVTRAPRWMRARTDSISPSTAAISMALPGSAPRSQRRSINRVCCLHSRATLPVATSKRASSSSVVSRPAPASRMTFATSTIFFGIVPRRTGFSAINSSSVGL